jgi:hypothetical protein
VVFHLLQQWGSALRQIMIDDAGKGLDPEKMKEAAN